MLKRIVSLCLVLCLMVTVLPLNARAAGTMESMRVVDTVVGNGDYIYDLDGSARRFSYDVPQGGATVLIFFSTVCGNCQYLFSQFPYSDWLSDPNVNIVAVESNSGEASAVRSFINDVAPGTDSYIDYSYATNAGLAFDYYWLFASSNSLTWPLVVVITEENGVKTVKSAGIAITSPGMIREAVESAIAGTGGSASGNSGIAQTEAKNAAAGTVPFQTYNLDYNTYDWNWASPVHSALAYEGGGYLRVENYNNAVYAEQYDSSFMLLSQKEIAMELPLFGGAYICNDYNFLVFGQHNFEENNNAEVIRVVRYSKDWQRQASASLYGANTTVPFDAGSLRFARSGNMLYIRTAHEMYTSSDGLNHQANLTMSVSISDMTVTDEYSRVMNAGKGYVSHSFNQFIQVDGTDLLAVDHGDAYPRAVTLFKYRQPAGQLTFTGNTDYVNVLPISGRIGDNYTGVQVGGFEYSSSHYLVAGISVDQNGGRQENVFITATAKNNFSETGTTLTYLTDYSSAEVGNPHLVKVDNNTFCLMWMKDNRLNFCLLDGTGRQTTDIQSAMARLSDCAPIVVDGKITWYVTGNGSYADTVPTFYQLDINAITSNPEPEQPGHTHSYTPQVTRPTCTAGGYTTYTCSCGDSYISDQTNALGHDYTTTETPAGCINGGYITTTCTRCEFAETEEIPALGHDWDDGRIVREPTSTVTGLKVYTCNRCGLTDEVSIPCTPPDESTSDIVRISGSNRCETAFAVADMLKTELGVQKFNTIIIANGNDFADALAGSYLASVKGAPILLHRNGSMAANVDYIRRNLAEGGTVYILGGEAAVPDSMVDALFEIDLWFSIIRLSGDNRFGTNGLILEEGGFTGGEILVCNSHNFADALSASATGLPILLVNNNTGRLTPYQQSVLAQASNLRFTIIGGTAAISENVANMLANYGSVSRVSGSNREATSVEVAKRYFSNPNRILLAYSRNFPDGLCGGPLAKAMGAPLLLTNARAEAVGAEYVAANAITRGVVLGGTAALPDATAGKVFGLADSTPIPMQ